MRRDIYLQVYIEALDDLAFYAMCGLENCGVSLWVSPLGQSFSRSRQTFLYILHEFAGEKSRVPSQRHKSLLYNNLYFREVRV
jgi:hypothetical protein